MEGTRSGRGRGRGTRQPTPVRETGETSTGPNPESQIDPNVQIAAAMQQMTNLLAQVVQQQGQNPNPNPGNPGNHVESEDRALERFQKFSPPKFIGGPDPDVAEKWLEKMVDIFAALHYPDERQVTFAVFQLEGAARSWWNVIRQKWEREQTPRTWVNFIREFNAKFFPPLVQERKEDEFIRLRQGAQTVAEYESQFTRLSKFAPELIMTEQRRIRRFIQGLNVEIQKDLAVAQLNAFSDAVEKAQRVETAGLQVRNFQARKRGFPGSSSEQADNSTISKVRKGNGEIRQPGVSRDVPQGGLVSATRGPCGYCGGPSHTETNCWKKEGKCLRCGSAEHRIANCPARLRERRGTLPPTKPNSQQPAKSNPGQTKGEGTGSKAPARVYSLEQHQVPDSSEDGEGMVRWVL